MYLKYYVRDAVDARSRGPAGFGGFASGSVLDF